MSDKMIRSLNSVQELEQAYRFLRQTGVRTHILQSKDGREYKVKACFFRHPGYIAHALRVVLGSVGDGDHEKEVSYDGKKIRVSSRGKSLLKEVLRL